MKVDVPDLLGFDRLRGTIEGSSLSQVELSSSNGVKSLACEMSERHSSALGQIGDDSQSGDLRRYSSLRNRE